MKYAIAVSALLFATTAVAQDEFGDTAPVTDSLSSGDWITETGVKTLQKGSKRICIGRVGVDFVTRAVGYARTGGGGPGRFKTTYGVGTRLQGLSKETYQAIADGAYDVTAKALTDRGFEVVPYDTCAESASMQKFGVRGETPGEEFDLGGIKFNSAQAMAVFTGATNGVRHIAYERPDYNALAIDVPNNTMKGGKAAKENGALMAHLDYVLEFQRHQGDIDVTTEFGIAFSIVHTNKTMQFRNDLYLSYVRGMFQDEKFRMAQFYRNPKGALLIVPGTEWMSGVEESDETWTKTQNDGGFLISVDEAEYKKRALELIGAYAGMYADELKAGIKQ
jgi:hypothetical protein